ncbi:hypothetical protein K0M31_002853, partial [Melipona bicolor]
LSSIKKIPTKNCKLVVSTISSVKDGTAKRRRRRIREKYPTFSERRTKKEKMKNYLPRL